MSTELAVQQPQEQGVLQVISRAAADPACDTGKMQALVDMQIKIMEIERKAQFETAMFALQQDLPVIPKMAKGANGKYASIEDIDERINPLLKKHGFHFTFTSAPIQGTKDSLITAKLWHRAGHCETASIAIQLDTSGSKNPSQGAVSTASYGIRALKRMMLDLTMVGEDRDGDTAKTITDQQAQNLEVLLAECAPAVKTRLLTVYAVKSVGDIPANCYNGAVSLLEAARRAK